MVCGCVDAVNDNANVQLVAIAMASRQPGSKVIICTDGKAYTDLGNLEVEDNNQQARYFLYSTIFYQDLGEYAASQGVTVAVLAIEGKDGRLDEQGRPADRTGGKATNLFGLFVTRGVIASPHELHTEFEIIENRMIATHFSVNLLLPTTLSVVPFSLFLAIIQLNSSQASAILAVRGRFRDTRRDWEMQRKLIKRAL
ncbi:uncharacterized protein ACWYII_047681 [Salvelinus alpinus]